MMVCPSIVADIVHKAQLVVGVFVFCFLNK